MFTGLIEETGRVARMTRGRDGATLVIRAEKTVEGTRVGDSIAVNGTCLTVTGIRGRTLEFDAMPETLAKSALADLRADQAVNLERAIAAGGRLGGHLVSGHVDGTGRVSAVARDGIARVIRIEAGRDIMRWILPKGSVAVDGVSLTISSVSGFSFEVSIIPHTAANTTLATRRAGDRVNVECDIAAKRAAAGGSADERPPRKRTIDMAFLTTHGFTED